MFRCVISVRSLVIFVGLQFAAGSRFSEETNVSRATDLEGRGQNPKTKVVRQPQVQPKTNTEPAFAQPVDGQAGRLRLADLLDSGNTAKAKQPFDIRNNIKEAAIAETLWAVRVLRKSDVRNEDLGMLWDQSWAVPSRQNTVQTRAPMELFMRWLNLVRYGMKYGSRLMLKNDLENLPITDPSKIAWAINGGDYGFKNGMDNYVLKRLQMFDLIGKGPSCEKVDVGERHDAVRNHLLFKKRGRVEVPQTSKKMRRKNSILNTNAGIAQLEDTPGEAMGYFQEEVVHGGKNFNERSGAMDQVDKLFWDLGAPFVAGASGSIEFLILSMEDMDIRTYHLGTVPCKTAALQTNDQRVYYRPLLREALIALMSAVLIAGGQHSLTECLSVAQIMGYFQDVPFVLRDYPAAAKGFQDYVDRFLGLKGSDGALSNLQAPVADAKQSGKK